MSGMSVLTEKAFKAMRDIDVDTLHSLPDTEIRPLLPSLVRMALCMTIDTSNDWLERKKKILQKLSATEIANSIVSLLSVDFHALEIDVRKELMTRGRAGYTAGESMLIDVLADGLALEFERSEGVRKLRLVISEVFAIQAYVKNNESYNAGLRSSELFDNEVYLDEISDVLCIAVAELPNTILLLELIEILLNVRNGPQYICRLVANSPETFQEVCFYLINNGDKQDEDTISGKTRLRAVQLLCQMNPSLSLAVRSYAVDNCKMPGLAVMITLDYHKYTVDTLARRNEVLSFVSGILMGSDDRTRTWFSQYVRIGQKKMEQLQSSSFSYLRKELQQIIASLLEEGIDAESVHDYTLIKACSVLRLYGALRSAPGMKFSEEETSLILKLVTSNPPATRVGIKLVTSSLCMLLSCSNLISNSESEKRAIQWVQNLVREEKYFGKNCKQTSSLGDTLLLVSIHFHGNQTNAIADLVSATLGMKIPIRAANLSRMRQIFTQEIFNEEMITTHAVKVPVTTNLNSNVAGFLPVHCIYQLLKNRSFTKHKIPIKDWIFKQICNSSAPLHPVLPSLIEQFVNSIIVPNTKVHNAQVTTNEPISQESLLSIFRHKIYSNEKDVMETNEVNCMLTTQLLLLMYILMYEDGRLNHMKTNGDRVIKHSAEVMEMIPIFYLVQEAKQDQQKFGPIFPVLLRLLATHHPHLCLVHDWLDIRLEEKTVAKYQLTNLDSLEEVFKEPFDIIRLEKSVDYIMRLPAKHLWLLSLTFVNFLPRVLEVELSDKLMIKIGKIWWRLNAIFPDNLWIMTVNALRTQSSFITKTQSWDDVVHDPLYVLRCDERVFRSSQLMKITLHILSAFLAASRTSLIHHLLEKPSRSIEDDKGREELKDALIRAQESAAVQILLECCIPLPSEESEPSDSLKEIQQIVCTHLHQMFILDKTLAKLVHFQTYDNRLLKLTVEAIPSMHICLEFIPELLSQPDLTKQIFAIELCSHLCVRYSTPKFLSAARLCFSVSSTLLSVLSGTKRTKFFVPVLVALVRMCDAFPPLKDDADALLKQLEQICTSKLAAQSTDFISANAAKKKYNPVRFLHLNPMEHKRYLDSMPDDDALFMIIQKSFYDLKHFKGNNHLIN